jgi:ribonuclease BN (tRNA processing enzyme)
LPDTPNKSLDASGGSALLRAKGKRQKEKDFAPPGQLRRWGSGARVTKNGRSWTDNPDCEIKQGRLSMPTQKLVLRAAMVITGWLLISPAVSRAQQQVVAPATHTQIVLLGTGNPSADPDRAGPATAIVVNGTPYLVDFGAGVVRRAKAAVVDRGVTALEPVNFHVVFVTHLHSDHTIGYADLIFTPSAQRKVPLEVYGPTGIKAMTEHLLQAYSVDIETRLRDAKIFGFPRVPQGTQVNAHEIKAGVVYKDANVTVTAFPTKHAMESYGYRFDTPERSIVISGDTNPTQETIDACHGCDVLIHEVSILASGTYAPAFQKFAAKYHTSTAQLADLASKAKPKLLILYHASIFERPAVGGPQAKLPGELLQEMVLRYSGHVVVGRDLDVY